MDSLRSRKIACITDMLCQIKSSVPRSIHKWTAQLMMERLEELELDEMFLRGELNVIEQYQDKQSDEAI